MKIAIIGTHGSGKTTLALQLFERLSVEFPGKTVGFLQEVAGRCPFKINRGGLESQLWIIQKQLLEEIEFCQAYNIVVCDRSLLDAYIYTKDVCNFFNIGMPGWIDGLVDYHMRSYDYIFKTELNPFFLQKDGVRSIDPHWQRLIENIFNAVLQEKKIAYFTLPKENPLEFILEKMGVFSNYRQGH